MRLRFLAYLTSICTFTAHAEQYDIIQRWSENVSSDVTITPQALVMHCMGTDLQRSLDILTKSVDHGGGGVSAHYFVPKITAGELYRHHSALVNQQTFRFPDQVPVFQLVPENQRAWHAGISKWHDLNTLAGCTASIMCHWR